MGGLRVRTPGGDQQEEHRGPGEAPQPSVTVCPRPHLPAAAPSLAWSSPLPTALPQVSTHQLHSSSDDEDDRLKEFNFPEEAVLQQVGWGAGRGACPACPHLP